MWWFGEKKRREARAQLAIRANPITLNPDAVEHKAFAQWRSAHIDRWLEANKDADPDKIEYLKAERNTLRAFLGDG